MVFVLLFLSDAEGQECLRPFYNNLNLPFHHCPGGMIVSPMGGVSFWLDPSFRNRIEKLPKFPF